METLSESEENKIKIRQHELQLLQNVSWTPMWRVTENMDKLSAVDDVNDKRPLLQDMNIYCDCCNQFLVQSSVNTIVGMDFDTLRWLTPILVLKHNKLDFSELKEYKSADGSEIIRPTQNDSCYNDLFMDYHHFDKTSKMLQNLLTQNDATVTVCSYVSESNLKVSKEHIDALRADSFIINKKQYMETMHALVYALFVADTRLNDQKRVHGPNGTSSNQPDIGARSPTKRSKKANRAEWSDEIYNCLYDEAKGIRIGFRQLLLRLWNRSVHGFMETIYSCEQHSITECGGLGTHDQCYLEFLLLKHGLQRKHISESITWFDCNMNCDLGSWDTYQMHFDFEKEFSYKNPWQDAKFYHDWTMCRRKSLSKKESQKQITNWFSPKSVQQVGLEFDSNLKESFMKKWDDNDPPKDPPIINSKPKKTVTYTLPKTGKEVQIMFPNKNWLLHRPLLLDKPPKDLFLDDEQGIGWDNMRRVKDILGPMYWNARNRSEKLDKAQSKKKTKDSENEEVSQLERIRRIKLQAAEEEANFLINRHMTSILAIVDPRTFQEKNKNFDSSEIAETLQPFIEDEKYSSTWKQYPLFIIKSEITQDDRDLFPHIRDWDERSVFVVHARMLKFFDLDFLEGLVKEAETRLREIKRTKNDNLVFCEFQPLPDSFNDRKNTSVVNFDKQFIQKVMPCSVYPRKMVSVAYNLNSNKWFRTDSCDIKDVLDDDDIFSKDILNMLMFAHTNIEIQLGEGHRNTFDSTIVIAPPISEPSIYEHHYRYNNEENKCVPGVFINLALIFKCNELATAIKLAFSEIDQSSPFGKCIKILGTFNNCFQYKWLMFKRNSNDTFVLDEYLKMTNMPIIITLYGKGSRAHCICIFGGQIIDGLYSRSFPYNKTNLRFTLGDGKFIRYIEHGIVIKPSKQIAERYLNGNEHKNSFTLDFEGYEKITGKNNRKRKRKG